MTTSTCTSGRLVVRSLKHGEKYYFIRLNLVQDTDGQTTYKTKQIATGLSATRKNKAKAQAMIENAIQEYQAGASLQLVDYCDAWLKRKRASIEEVTAYGYEYKISFIRAFFGDKDVTVKSLSVKDVEQFYLWLLEYRRQQDQEHLVNQSIHDIAVTFRMILRDALKRGEIKTNPCDAVNIPSRPQKVKLKPYLDEESLPLFLDAIHGTNVELPFLMTLYGGLRREELAGLRWKAIREGSCYVEHTVTGTGSVIEKDRAKNPSSVRSFPLPEEILLMLQEEKERQERNRQLLGSAWQDTGYIFVKANGESYRPDYFTRRFKEIVKSVPGLDPDLHFYSLRTSCVTLMLEKGVPVKKVAEWVGHKNPATTQNIYASTNLRQQKKLAEEWSGYLLEKANS